MRLLITGATGFIGRQLVKDLKNSNTKFTCLLRRSAKNEQFVRENKLDVLYADLNDKQLLESSIKKFDIAIHLAALLRNNDAALLKKVNVEGTSNLLSACKLNNVKRFIYISSYLASPQFSSNYGISKRISENLVKPSGIDYTILRPTLVYGKNDYYMAKITNLVRKYRFVLLPGNFSLQPVHVKDVSSAILSCIKNKSSINKEYYLAGSKVISMKELVNLIASNLSLKRMPISIPIFLVKPAAFIFQSFSKDPLINIQQLNDLERFSSIDISAAEKDLAFTPVAIEEGIKDVL